MSEKLLGEFENPVVECPKCGAEYEDFDGFGVVHCAECGYCQHLTGSGGICDFCGENLADRARAEYTPPTIPIRTASEIDAECLAAARVYIAADRDGGLSPATLLALFARVAALMWVLCPGESETSAQGKAWGLIAEIRGGGDE